MKTIRKAFVVLITLGIVLSMSALVSAAGTKVELVSMHELESDYVSVMEKGITDSYGKTYESNVLSFSSGDRAYVIYDLNGAYSKFEGTIVCGTNTGSNAVIDVGIFADGELVYSLTGYTRQKPAESVSIDVSGVNELAIKTVKTKGSGGYLYFVDSSFEKADSVSPCPNRSTLSDLVIIDSKSCNTSNRLFWDAFGDVHNEWTRFTCGENGYILYNLDEKFVSFTGCITPGEDTGSTVSMNIEFYLDDNLVFSKEGVTKTTKPINFDIDVTDASVLKITTSKSDGSYSYLYVTDSILKPHEHTPGEWIVESEATCSKDGVRSIHCTGCNEVLQTEKIPALGHKPDGKSVVTKKATCSEPGEEAQHCSVCGEPIEVKVIDALGHTPDGEWKVIKEATCAEEGEEVQYCTVCGGVAESRGIEKKAHTPSKEWKTVREATCAEEGLRQKTCTVCGGVAEEEVIEKIDHKFGSWTTLSGSVWNNPIVKERTCSVCGKVEHVESNSTSWLKPLVIVFLIIVFGGLAVILVTLKMNGLPLELGSVKKLFSKETLSDTDIENLLNKKDDTEHKK